MRWCILTTLALAFSMLAGCGSEVDYSCEINDDCVEGRLCGPEGECIQQDPVRIVTEALPDATVDAEYSFTLEAADGISPYTWSLNEKPDWMSIDPGTGTLTGTPDQVATGLAVKVRVEDSTTGRDSYNLAELSIDVNLCSEGDTTVCYEPDKGKCLEGIKRCSGSEWGPCGDSTFSTNKDHCGPDCEACDERISDRCTRGACACGDGAPCTGDEICCEADCIDPLTDSQNCGGCGASCEGTMQNATNPHCEDGICVYDACATGFLDCNDVTQDGCETEVSLSRCGACDRDCSVVTHHVEEILCVDTAGTFDCGYQGDGTHGEGCEFGYLDCDGNRQNGCETPADSQNHCGSCGNVCDAICMLHPDGDHYYCGCGDHADCGGGRLCCDGVCVSTDDPAHCGSCDNDCTQAVKNAETILCDQGICGYTDCLDLFLDCDSDRTNGCETPMSDNNCGQCGYSCGPNAHCIEGSCACVTQWGNCDDDWSDGCETNLAVTVEHCGNCDTNCNVQVQNASNIDCSASLCTYGACNTGWDNCDDDRTNGCETDIMNDDQNCGDCHLSCKPVNGTNYCGSGVCHPNCMSGWGDCDATPSNGCETGLLDNIDHCGACDYNCILHVPHATGRVCSNGICDYQSCVSDFDDCDDDRTNGCETYLQNTVDHCGSCDNDCNTNVTHASGIICSGGLCDYDSCNTDHDDCDGDRTNGCEAWLKMDPNNCGECGHICTEPNIMCQNGICQEPF